MLIDPIFLKLRRARTKRPWEKYCMGALRLAGHVWIRLTSLRIKRPWEKYCMGALRLAGHIWIRLASLPTKRPWGKYCMGALRLAGRVWIRLASLRIKRPWEKYCMGALRLAGRVWIRLASLPTKRPWGKRCMGALRLAGRVWIRLTSLRIKRPWEKYCMGALRLAGRVWIRLASLRIKRPWGKRCMGALRLAGHIWIRLASLPTKRPWGKRCMGALRLAGYVWIGLASLGVLEWHTMSALAQTPPKAQAPQIPLPAPKAEARQKAAQPNLKPTAKPKGKKGKRVRSNARVELNFEKVSIPTFLRMMSEALDLALVWDESKVRGEITLTSPKAFKKADALRIFESVLSLHGYSILKQDGAPLAQVVPSKEASRQPSTLRQGGPSLGRFFETRIIPLRYIDANALRNTLAPLLSTTAGITVHTQANVLVLADSPAGIRRALRIIRALDVPAGDGEFRVIPLKYADASTLASMLSNMNRNRQPRQAQQSKALSIVAETRTNSLVLSGSREEVNRSVKIVSKLDIPSTDRPRGFRVMRLKHANAEEVLKILREVDVRSASSAIATAGENENQTPRPGGSPPPPGGGNNTRNPRKPTPFNISADPATNSLVAFGAESVLNAVEGMVSELDVDQPQVLVELLIMEVSLKKSLRLGVRWQGGNANNDGIGGIGFPDSTPRSLAESLEGSQNALVGVVGNSITFGGQSFVTFRGFLQATQDDQDLDVLANPQILTLNNKTAEINVGSVVPVSTRTVTNSQLQTTTEYEFKDVGVLLKITPQITAGNKVRLKIEQEISSIATQENITSSEQQQAITTLKRKINTEVLINNRSTMAIGGLIQSQTVKNLTKTPCLGDLWLIGHLFRYRQDEIRKTNLIVFIRPSVIRNQDDLRKISDRLDNRYQNGNDLDKKQNQREELRKDFELPKTNRP